ncbi:MAG: LicD family protein [Eubacterium sp.]|nr:LicD family protein [Candidatus Colimonas fimequi]
MIRNEDQRILWEFFKRIAEFLNDNNFKYYLSSGTAIGAIRHKGFIPWDDDIDLMMDRENYDRLISMADKLPWDDIELVSSEISDNYFRPFAQFSAKKDTNFLKSGMFNMGECMGTLVDVFCVDKINSSRLDEYERDVLLYQETLADAFVYKYDVVQCADECLKLRQECREKGKRPVIQRLKAKLESYADDDCDEYVVRFFFTHHLNHFAIEGLEGERLVEFEGVKFPIPTNQEEFLRWHYGYDWYILPNVQGQESHDFYKDADISSRNYFEDMSNFIDWDEAKENLAHRKDITLERLKYKSKVDTYNKKLAAAKTIMRSNIEQNAVKIDELFARREYAEVVDITMPLTNGFKSLLPENVGNNGLTLQTVGKWIYSLTVKGEYYKGHKILSRIVPDWESRSNEDENLDFFGKVLSLVEYYQDHKVEELHNYVSELPVDKWSDIPDYLTALAYLSKEGRNLIADDKLLDLCENYLKTYPENWEVLKIKADLTAESNKDEAMSIYRKIYDNTSNGLLILELKDKFNFDDKFN